MDESSLHGEWAVLMEGSPEDMDEAPRLMLRAGQVFEATAAEPIGSYSMGVAGALLMLDDGRTIAVRPALSPDQFSATVTFHHPDDEPFSEAAAFIRVGLPATN